MAVEKDWQVRLIVVGVFYGINAVPTFLDFNSRRPKWVRKDCFFTVVLWPLVSLIGGALWPLCGLGYILWHCFPTNFTTCCGISCARKPNPGNEDAGGMELGAGRRKKHEGGGHVDAPH